MGFLDNIFKKKEKAAESVVQEQKSETNMPAFRTTSDGRLQVEFYNGATTQREFYDTTKLTIDTNSPFNLGGKLLYNCVVAWDGTGDCIIFDEQRMKRAEVAGNRDDYKGVWLELDLAKLQTDPAYCSVLMNKLLLKSRVSKMIEEGLKETPERPCGKYVGAVRMIEGVYKKSFDAMVGNAAHQTPLMRDRRAKLRQQEKERRAMQIEENKRKIEALKAENQSLEMD